QTIKWDSIKPILSLIKTKIEQKDSPIRTDLFKTVNILGKKNFEFIRDVYSIFVDELRTKNRFRIKIILDLIANLAHTDIPMVSQTIKDIFLNGKDWFDEPQLIPYYFQFFETVTKYGYKFTSKYQSEMSKLTEELPISMDNIRGLIKEKMFNYQNFLEEEEKRRIAERKKKEELEKKKKEKEKIKLYKKIKLKEEEEKRKKDLEKKKREKNKYYHEIFQHLTRKTQTTTEPLSSPSLIYWIWIKTKKG
ncbi:MAG: hypothetical protein ACTSRG_27435, partial [Candidatus Helarchaeota archaeon]